MNLTDLSQVAKVKFCVYFASCRVVGISRMDIEMINASWLWTSPKLVVQTLH